MMQLIVNVEIALATSACKLKLNSKFNIFFEENVTFSFMIVFIIVQDVVKICQKIFKVL